MATLSDLTKRVRQNLYGSFPTESPFITQLGDSHDDSTSSIEVLDDDQWEINDIGENVETDEQFLVLAKPGSDVLTVSRGFNGTTPAASDGSDDLIRKNPRFDGEFIAQAIQDTLDTLELWGIHTFGQTTVTRADPEFFYELEETDILDTYGVLRVYEVGSVTSDDRPRTLPFRYAQKLGTGPSEYDEGQGLTILDWGGTNDGDDVHVVYAQKTNSVDDLLTRQETLVVNGALSVLLGGTIIPATHDPGARSDRTTPPGQTSRDVRFFQGQFITGARREAANLGVERVNLLSEPTRHARARRWRP